MNRAARLVSLWLPVAAWCSLIFYLSSVPNLKTDLGFWDTVLRKAAHMVEFGALYLLLRRAFAGGTRLTMREAVAASAVGAFIYAVSDEMHQAFVSTRGPSPLDVAIDSAGIVLAHLGARLGRKSRRN